MAVSSKYAHLPDVDAAPEIYETPELADDVSTAQTGTLRTISPSPSEDEARPGLDRQHLDRDGARRKFEPSQVDARDVDFSDTIAGTRRSYRTRSSRRRRRRLEDGAEELGDLSDSEDETLSRKLARLKREAEEVRLEIQQREQEKDTDEKLKETVEQHDGEDEHDANVDGVEQLSKVLDQLSTKAGSRSSGSLENQFLSRLDARSIRRNGQETNRPVAAQKEDTQTAPSALSAVAAFSDRLTALEAALGIPSTNVESQTLSLLPTLDGLAKQITVLSNTLAPKSSTASSNSQPPPILNGVSSKLKTLIAESDRLTASRKQAQQALVELHEVRMRQLGYSGSRPRRGFSNASANNKTDADQAGPGDESLQIQSQVFLDEQSTKITALYQVLPTIQNLQPLLPTVLDRLRELHVIHAGAADAKNNLDAVEKSQAETREEIKQWRQAVEDVEKGMADLEDAMKGNVEVVGEMVSGLESRMAKLHQ
ncbi:dynactin 2 [Exophiala viscosa]|uniref:dynactin 2 n=1 Tax=Exophiala viscosa TaxID=2486360 RepID=UPI0021952017|nr:dynactin 2 [Exophiala viscosa]